MHQTAKQASPLPTMEYGRVAASGHAGPQPAPGFTVDTANGRYKARAAKSCLLAPEPGDTVLLCTDEIGHCFILAVLEGPGNSGSIEFSGELNLRVRDGGLHIAADKEIELAADEIGFVARQARATFETFTMLAETLRGQCRSVSLAADACTQSLHSLTQRLGAYFRTTKEHEEIQAGSTRTLVEDTRVLHCKNSVLMAEEDARIDADQIQLG